MPLTLGAIKRHLRVDGCAEDDLIRHYVASAIEAAEAYSGTRIRPGEVSEVIDRPVGSAFRLRATPAGSVVARITMMDGHVYAKTARVSGRVALLPVELGCGALQLELRYTVGPVAAEGERPRTGDEELVVAASPLMESGVLKFVAHAYTHRGDAPNSWLVDSGAMDDWRPRRAVFF